MTTCVSTQILWDADNAKMSGELRQRTLRFCEEAQPCPLISAEERILQVSSQRDLTSAPHSTAPLLRPHSRPHSPAGPFVGQHALQERQTAPRSSAPAA